MADDVTLSLILNSVQELSRSISALRDDIHAMKLANTDASRDMLELTARVKVLELASSEMQEDLETLKPVAETYTEIRRKFIAAIASLVLAGRCFAGYISGKITTDRLGLPETSVKGK